MAILKDKILEANKLFNMNQLTKAEKIYRDIIKEEPGYADIYYKLGLISHNKENFSKAIDYFEKALAINRNYYEALMGLSITYNHIGKVEKGREYFNRAMSLSEAPHRDLDLIQRYRLANEHMEIADVYEEAGVHHKAILEYKMALELCPDFHDIREKLGRAFMESEDYGMAIKEFQYINEKNPKNIRAINFLGLCYYKMGDLDQAREHWEKAQSLSTGDSFSKIYLDLLDKNQSGVNN